jgi:hypothetical protein
MKTYTDAEGLAAIEVAKRLDKATAIIRLFAIAQVFYRQPVGVRACEELDRIIDWETSSAVFFISGFSGIPPTEKWAEIACIGAPDPSAVQAIPIARRP